MMHTSRCTCAMRAYTHTPCTVCLLLSALVAVGTSIAFNTTQRIYGAVSLSGKSMNVAYAGTATAACVVWNVTTATNQMGGCAHTNRHTTTDCTRACAQAGGCTSLSYEPSANMCRLIQGIMPSTSTSNGTCLSSANLVNGVASSAYVYDVISVT
jgi:hypothetical protein